ncbi:hypothetical protein [Streptomyces sp. NPDC046197]|uniref:hypothetical protein n=1 Tax=Streptomyces sp. NPDC046197 TaxID=3154337 RepID=UPI0033D5737C
MGDGDEPAGPARRLSGVAPVLAIGDPADRLPPLGAKRVYCRERGGGWKKVAGGLIHAASLTGRLLIVACGDGHDCERFRQRA